MAKLAELYNCQIHSIDPHILHYAGLACELRSTRVNKRLGNSTASSVGATEEMARRRVARLIIDNNIDLVPGIKRENPLMRLGTLHGMHGLLCVAVYASVLEPMVKVKFVKADSSLINGDHLFVSVSCLDESLLCSTAFLWLN